MGMQKQGEVVENNEGPRSLGAILLRSCEKYGPSAAYLRPGPNEVTRITYTELEGMVRRWASGLRSLNWNRGDTVCLMSENCLEWSLMDWACQTLGIILVPIYPTLPADQAQYIAENCHAKAVVCGDEELTHRLAKMNPAIIFLLNSGPQSIEKIASEAPMMEKEAWKREIEQAKPEDTATIIYTSGTTGPPKGVVLTHRNFIWMNGAVAKGFDIGQGDVFFSFLPLSHVFARANDHFLPISLGSAIGLNRNLASLAKDIVQVRPTLMLVVPRFLDAMKDRITDAALKGPAMSAKIFRLALQQGRAHTEGKMAPLFPLLKNLVGKKVQERLGGHLRFFVSGGAALPRDTFSFYEAMGVKVLQGYGLTETTSGIYLNPPDQVNRPDTVGQPLDGVETKIAEDGEILVRGPFLMKEYFELPEDTARAIDEEGWFHTGDVGVIDGNHLKITDRKKDLIVLGNGKNVAPQPIENRLRQGEHIAEAVVLGDGLEGCIALIVPNFERLRADVGPAGSSSAASQGGASSPSSSEGSGHTNQALIENPIAKALIKKEIDAVNQTLAQFERIKRHALLPDSFSIEGGELTPSLKVKRKVVKEKYRDIIAELSR